MNRKVGFILVLLALSLAGNLYFGMQNASLKQSLHQTEGAPLYPTMRLVLAHSQVCFTAAELLEDADETDLFTTHITSASNVLFDSQPSSVTNIILAQGDPLRGVLDRLPEVYVWSRDAHVSDAAQRAHLRDLYSQLAMMLHDPAGETSVYHAVQNEAWLTPAGLQRMDDINALIDEFELLLSPQQAT